MSPIDPPLYEENENDSLWSDDVSLALCFLASLAHHGDYSQEHLLQRYFQWWMNGYMCPTGLCFTLHSDIKKNQLIYLVKLKRLKMFGKNTSIDVFIVYIELLVNALNGHSKNKISLN
ncbi:unnamed protein product [Rotaria sp. Silwood2]|nr:unnamed protein product [Rotaria sp. Silwood2]CAF3099443.1 unnamed protein product [Rotaria sp. Silwood2]